MNKIKFAVGVGLLLSLLTACASADAEAEPVPSATAESLFAETGQFTPEIILVILEDEDWGELGLFRYDEEYNAFAFAFTDPDMLEFLEMLPDEPSLRDEWRGLTDSFDELSTTLFALLDGGCSFYIDDPNDPDGIIYLAINGDTVYDFMSD